MNIFIGGAWPYANGSLHLGHIAALLPGDILARYYRQKGEDVLYVSGSDCNGTPIALKASKEGVTVTEIADKYHKEFVDCFKQLGFSYDSYTRTDTNRHHEEVQKIFLSLLKNGYLYKKTVKQAFCLKDNQFLPDRYVEGLCPNCGAQARGDQCDNCSAILDPLDLNDRACSICGNEPEIRETEHFYFSFSQFQLALEKELKRATATNEWRQNAINLTKRYLEQGVHDRAVTRDLSNGVPVPLPEFRNKKIYVWIEAVSGYYSSCVSWGIDNNKTIAPWWSNETISYYVHGKDNIPFHTIIWPSILLGLNKVPLPRMIVSNEYLTLEKRKISTSKNWAVWVTDMLKKYHPDSIRYYLTINAPEKHDTDFSWREFIYSHNSELLGAFANFINRTLKFIEKNYQNYPPQVQVDECMIEGTKILYQKVGNKIEKGSTKKALEEIFSFVRSANKYFDEQIPWITVKVDTKRCERTIATCTLIIANLGQLIAPFLPFATKNIEKMLNMRLNSWVHIDQLTEKISDVRPLYSRIDIAKITEELQLLERNSINK